MVNSVNNIPLVLMVRTISLVRRIGKQVRPRILFSILPHNFKINIENKSSSLHGIFWIGVKTVQQQLIAKPCTSSWRHKNETLH